jgi:biotin carboxylase
MNGRVVIVDPYSSGARLARPLRTAGLEAVAVRSHPVPPPIYTRAYRPEDFDTILTATEDIEPLVRQLAGYEPVAVIPGAESGVTLADHLAARLVPARANDPALIDARRHKGAMVSALRAKGVPSIRTVCTSAPEEAARWVSREGLDGCDLVVKPATSGGTEDVTLLPGGVGLDATMRRLLGKVNVLGLPNREVLVQERLRGTEYVVDTFSHDGRHTVTNVCRYRKVANGSHFAVYESVEFLPYDADGNAGLIAYVEQVLDALGVRFGPAHNEVMVTPDGPVLIETGVRLPGGGLPALTELATGDSGEHRLIRHLSGDGDIRPGYRLEWHVSSVYLMVKRTGVLTNTAAYQQIRALPSCRFLQVNVRDGVRVAATSDLLSTMGVGWAVLAHQDCDQIRRDHAAVREIEQQVRIVDDALDPAPQDA